MPRSDTKQRLILVDVPTEIMRFGSMWVDDLSGCSQSRCEMKVMNKQK